MLAEFVIVPTPNKAGQRVAVFAIFFFVFFYGFFVDAASFIYSSEIYPTHIRARGVAMATATYFIACIVCVYFPFFFSSPVCLTWVVGVED